MAAFDPWTTTDEPEGRFHTICADPPWPYSGAGPVGTGGRGAGFVREFPGVGAVDRYNLMSMQDLKDLPVDDWAESNAHLYLWTTNGFMDEAYDLARAWGFNPKTIITWGKVKKDDPATPSMKSGYYFRGATEHALFCTRGTLPKPTIAIPTLYLHPRIAQHSSKPERFYTNVVEKISPGPYLEMFARTSREGWTAWGNQAPKG